MRRNIKLAELLDITIIKKTKIKNVGLVRFELTIDGSLRTLP